jgi:hypothetical protein
MRALEEMGQDSLTFSDSPDVLAHTEITSSVLGSFPGLINSLRNGRIGFDSSGRSARLRRHLCHHSSNSSATARSILATAPAVRESE